MLWKTLFTAAAVATVACLAEYQVYDYRATIRRVEATSGGAAALITERLDGVLVSVACYPCGADSGKGYECWLFLVSRREGRQTVWRVPCEIDEGMFGPPCRSEKLSDWAWLQPTNEDKTIMRRATKAWIHFEFDTVKAEYNGNGLWGKAAIRGHLSHDGYGSGRTKINSATDDPSAVFNPYLGYASGTVTGWLQMTRQYGFDPSSRSAETAAPITGTFAIKYNAMLTEKIRGTADWNEIARRILLHFQYTRLLEEDYDDSLMWQTYPEKRPADPQE